jgi:hypothetical protein
MGRVSDRPIGAGVAANRFLPLAAIVGAALVLTLPAALGLTRLNDSFWIDWVWLDQFAREFGRGVIYPRWLPLSHAGLGSPVFYYYPPLAFFAASPFVLGGMSSYGALLATFGAAYALSGAAMYWWLKPQSRHPLAGAFAFMVAPYHAFNFYNRGAIAEFLATAILPLVLAGLWRMKHRKRGGFALTAVAYAALIDTHLPLALLASVFLIGPILLLEGYKSPKDIAPAVVALAIGIALAAIYWIPAIFLEPYRDSAKLWADPVLQPSNWTFWNPAFAGSPAYVAVLVIGAALAIPLVGLVVRQRSGWAAFGLLCVALAIGVIPVLWSLPLLRSVQFPFRLLPVAEFALATAVARAAWRPQALAVALAPLLAISGFIMTEPPAEQGVSKADVELSHADVPENLPPGNRPYSWPSRWALQIAAAHPSAQFDGRMTVEPVFYFPAWQVRCEGRVVRTFPAPGTQLLAYAGRGCSRTLVVTRAERIGTALSLIALLLLVTLQLIPALRRPLNRSGTGA